MEFSIGELARRAGVTRRTIRYYVEMGLLPPPGGAGRAARYTADHLSRLEQIRALQAQRLSLEEIREHLAEPSAPFPSTAFDAPLASMAISASIPPPPRAASSRMHRLISALSAEQGALLRAEAASETPSYEAAQWLRIMLAPDVELHVRRRGTRLDRRIGRLVAEARRILSSEETE